MKLWKGNPRILDDLKETEKYIHKALKTRQPTLSKAIEELLEAGGKRLRPALVLLSGGFGDYDKDRLMPLAAGIEILHMATLVHDDIIDDADIRRGEPTVQAKWGKDMAVFTGDFLLTRAFSLITQNVEFDNMHKLSNVMKAICEGEIDQYGSRYDLNTSVKAYLKRIGRKTALLFSLSCRVGADESRCSPKVVWNLWHFGKNLGMAFQIVDDLLDFSGDVQMVGKPLLVDFASGVFTLPIIYTANIPEYRIKFQKIIDKGEFTYEELAKIKGWTDESGGTEYANRLAQRYIYRAMKNLEQLPATGPRDSLRNLTEELQERQY
ncbi:MAG TPA: polyprenyl synthetase family protein [Clostridia bacterium]|nr:polyprenyl synthetase family protein [Clostridia bacterium]